jgi:hypothetical protein
LLLLLYSVPIPLAKEAARVLQHPAEGGDVRWGAIADLVRAGELVEPESVVLGGGCVVFGVVFVVVVWWWWWLGGCLWCGGWELL